MPIIADLHVHSTASDGDLSPEQLVDAALYAHLHTIALTDHDTLSGVAEALRTGSAKGITVIPGVEISAVFDPGTLHILGYFPRYPDGLEKSLEEIQRARAHRVPKIISKLNDLGIALRIEDVEASSSDSQIGRPHIAKALIAKGYVQDFEEAFSRYLAKGKQAYVEKEKMTWEKSIDLIRHHGGLPVLAHPFTLNLSAKDLLSFTGDLKNAGLAGIEVLYPDHTRSQKKLYRRIAQTLDLFITGGTDYHGPSSNSVNIGEYGIDSEALHIIMKRLNGTALV
ncbi:MAG: PHP domain-containing protein [Desulfomonilia bacterium]